MATVASTQLFNGPIEIGLRCLVLLLEAFPSELDLQKLVTLDYLLVHSGDVAGGPRSLHPPSPLRAGEVAVRRGILEDGLRLYRTRGLISQLLSPDGIRYVADESAAGFVDALSSAYVAELRVRAEWIFEGLGLLDGDALARVLEDSLGRWRTEFALLTEEGDPG